MVTKANIRWVSSIPEYNDLFLNSYEFKKKEGGAKNAGEYTGVYTFNGKERSETILFKQGETVGETIAEFVGGQLYQLTLGELSAKCIIAKTNQSGLESINDLYVGSFYPKNKVVDGFKSVGSKTRHKFAGIRARIDKRLNRNFNIRESQIRKIIQLDQERANFSLSFAAPSVLWHGDLDFHSGNFVLTEDEQGKEKFIKIDHGFSFFNFNDELPNIFDPTAGKVANFSLKRKIKGGSLIEFYPTNHFWDFAVEASSFYYNQYFIDACNEISKLDNNLIFNNINTSLNYVMNLFENKEVGYDALRVFGKRIGAPKSIFSNKNDEIVNRLTFYMIEKLVLRKSKIQELGQLCKKRQLSQSEITVSQKANKHILKSQSLSVHDDSYSYDDKKKTVSFSNVLYTDSLRVKKTFDEISMIINDEISSEEINLCKIIQQALDKKIIISNDNNLAIEQGFFYFSNGKAEYISTEAFKEMIKNIIENKGNKIGFKINDKILFSLDGIDLINDIKIVVANNKPNKQRGIKG